MVASKLLFSLIYYTISDKSKFHNLLLCPQLYPCIVSQHIILLAGQTPPRVYICIPCLSLRGALPPSNRPNSSHGLNTQKSTKLHKTAQNDALHIESRADMRFLS